MKLEFAGLMLAVVLISSATAFAKPAGCPCNPCKCSPCSCGGGGKGDKHHHHDHGGVGVGFGVDLGGVGQRSREPDPFASSSTSSTSGHTTDRGTTTHHSTSNVFANVELTGAKAKGDESSAKDARAGTAK